MPIVTDADDGIQLSDEHTSSLAGIQQEIVDFLRELNDLEKELTTPTAAMSGISLTDDDESPHARRYKQMKEK